MSRHTMIVEMPSKVTLPANLVGPAVKDAAKRLATVEPGSAIEVAYGYDRTYLYYIQAIQGDGDLLMDIDTRNNNLGHGAMLEMMVMFKVGSEQDKMLVAADLPI